MDAMIHHAHRQARTLRKTAGARNSVAGSVLMFVKPKNARTRRGGLKTPTRPFRFRRGGAGAGALHRQARDHGRGSGATSVNLKECIRDGETPGGLHQHRLSRPDRRRESIPRWRRGPFSRKDFIKRKSWKSPPTRTRTWISGLECGLRGRAQIGKGMWAAPDAMAAMLEAKIRASPRGRQLRLGRRRPRPRCCMRCIITGSTWPRCRPRWRRAVGAPT